VDIVVEDRVGALVGIEVKAGATVNTGDFKGLRKLAEACGSDFKLGVVLYEGETSVPPLATAFMPRRCRVFGRDTAPRVEHRPSDGVVAWIGRGPSYPLPGEFTRRC